MIFVEHSDISGQGIFSDKPLKKGEIIGTVIGPVVPDNKESYKKYGDYLHPINYDEAIVNINFTRFTNHSCNPNCGLKDAVTLVAIRDIETGEELTIDYDTLEYDWEMECNCGSENCRGKIRGYKHLKEKKPYVAPYLLEPK